MKTRIRQFLRRQRQWGGFFELRYESRESWFLGHGILLAVLLLGVIEGLVIGWLLELIGVIGWLLGLIGAIWATTNSIR